MVGDMSMGRAESRATCFRTCLPALLAAEFCLPTNSVALPCTQVAITPHAHSVVTVQ